MRQQLELTLPRKRVALIESDVLAGSMDPSVGSTVYFKNDREGEMVDGLWIEYTDWQEGPPPCDGWWQINGGNGDGAVMAWRDGARDEYRYDLERFGAFVSVALTNASVLYRGLSHPAPGGYDWYVPGAATRVAGPGRRALLKEES